jgi:hypothetical protein
MEVAMELWQRRRCGRRITPGDFQFEAHEVVHKLSRRERHMFNRARQAVEIGAGEALTEEDAAAIMDTALLSYLKSARSQPLEMAILKRFEPFGEA